MAAVQEQKEVPCVELLIGKNKPVFIKHLHLYLTIFDIEKLTHSFDALSPERMSMGFHGITSISFQNANLKFIRNL